MNRAPINELHRPRRTFLWSAEILGFTVLIAAVFALILLALAHETSSVSTLVFVSGAVVPTLWLVVPAAFICTVLAYVVAYIAVIAAPRLLVPVLIVAALVFALSHYVFLRGLTVWSVENGIIHSLVKIFWPGASEWSQTEIPRAAYWLLAGLKYFPLSVLFFVASLTKFGPGFDAVCRNLGVGVVRRHLLTILTVGRAPFVLSSVLVALLLAIDPVAPNLLLQGIYPTIGTKISSLGRTVEAQHHAAMLILGTLAVGGLLIVVFGALLSGQAMSGKYFPGIKASLVRGPSRSGYAVGLFLILLVAAVFLGLLVQALGFEARYGGMFSGAAIKHAGTDGFLDLIRDNQIRSGMRLSAIVAFGASAIACGAGCASAIRLFLRQQALPVWLYLLLVPLILPQALLGHAFALLNEYHLLPNNGFARGLLLMLVHAGMFVSVTVFIVHVALSRYGERYTEALVAGGENLGLSSYVIARETWRTWLPAALAGAMAVACLSLNEVVAAQHLLGVDTLAVVLESRHQAGMREGDFAACVLLLVATTTLMVAAWGVLRRVERN